MRVIYSREITARGAINKYGKLGYFLQVEYFIIAEEEEANAVKLFNKGKHIKFTKIDKLDFEARYHFKIDLEGSSTSLIYKQKLHNINKEY